MAFQDRWVGQRPLHVKDRNRGDMTGEHCERPAIAGPDDLATSAPIAHVKELPNHTAIRALEPDVELRAVKDGNFLADREHLAIW